MDEIEIFRAGTHTSMSGEQVTFGDQEIADAAQSYDPSKHEAPITVGHPKDDAPAYGWIDRLVAKGKSLVAQVKQVDPEFQQLVKDGRFKKVSAAFYRPTDSNNPTPGKWHLRHLAFLGGMPPAVKGLKQFAFADQEPVIFSEKSALEVGMDSEDVKRQLDDLSKKMDELKAREIAFAERQKAFVVKENEKFVKENAERIGGKEQQAKVLGFMEQLIGSDMVVFSEGGQKSENTLLGKFREIISALPKGVVFGEVAAETSEAPEDDMQLVKFADSHVINNPNINKIYAKAVSYQKAHPDVKFIDAYKAVGGV